MANEASAASKYKVGDRFRSKAELTHSDTYDGNDVTEPAGTEGTITKVTVGTSPPFPLYQFEICRPDGSVGAFLFLNDYELDEEFEPVSAPPEPAKVTAHVNDLKPAQVHSVYDELAETFDGVPVSDLLVGVAEYARNRAESLCVNHADPAKGRALYTIADDLDGLAADAGKIGE